jgi:hypothetical protein
MIHRDTSGPLLLEVAALWESLPLVLPRARMLVGIVGVFVGASLGRTSSRRERKGGEARHTKEGTRGATRWVRTPAGKHLGRVGIDGGPVDHEWSHARFAVHNDVIRSHPSSIRGLATYADSRLYPRVATWQP